MLNDATGFKHIYIRVGYTDLRSGIDTLAAIVQNSFHQDPFCPDNLYMFCGRRTDRIKCLTYEGDGFLLLYKRLSDGNFQWPRTPQEVKEITPRQFRWLMEGLCIEQKKVIFKTSPSRI